MFQFFFWLFTDRKRNHYAHWMNLFNFSQLNKKVSDYENQEKKEALARVELATLRLRSECNNHYAKEPFRTASKLLLYD